MVARHNAAMDTIAFLGMGLMGLGWGAIVSLPFAIFSQATSPLCPGGMEMSMSRMSGFSRATMA